MKSSEFFFLRFIDLFIFEEEINVGGKRGPVTVVTLFLFEYFAFSC